MKKRTWMTLHRWLGLVCLLPFIGLVITGWMLVASSPITAQQQITTEQQQLVLPRIAKAVDGLTVNQADAPITLILAGAKLGDDWRVQLSNNSSLWIDPNNGNVHKESVDGQAHQWWLKAHNTLFVGRYGPYFVLLAGFFILALAVSGLFTQANLYRAVIAKPRPTSLRYWHRWLSLVFSALLLLSCVSGMLLVAYKLIMQMPNDKPVAAVQQSHQAASVMNMAAIVETLLAQPSKRVVQGIMISRTAPKTVTVMMLDREANWWNKSVALMFDANTGQPQATDPPSVFWKILVAIKAIHIGIWGSTATAWLYLLIASAMLFSIGSGLLLWAQRRWRLGNRYLTSSV